MTVVLGVDPGSRSCGLVVRDGARLVAHTTVWRRDDQDRAAWVDFCLEAVFNLCNPLHSFDLLAVEDIRTPSPHVGKKLIDPTYVMDTAAVAGAVTGWAWTDHWWAIWVPPDGNGSGPIDNYPVELRPARGKGAGHDTLRHCRSAWDVAGTGLLLSRGRRV